MVVTDMMEAGDAGDVSEEVRRIYEQLLLLQKGEMDLRSAVANIIQAQSMLFTYSAESNIAGTIRNFQKIEEEIRGIGKQSANIKKILQKTRILSVNAAVEAAHVGIAGLGFGVVAEEIGSLATQTESCTAEVEKLSQSLFEDSDVSMATLADLRDGLVSYTDASRGLMADAKRVLTIEENGFILTTIAKRMENHADYLRTLLRNAGKADQIADHHTCAFGRWYDQNRDRYQRIRGFKDIYEPHKAFHSAAIDFNRTLKIEYLGKLVVLSGEMLSRFLALADGFKADIGAQ